MKDPKRMNARRDGGSVNRFAHADQKKANSIASVHDFLNKKEDQLYEEALQKVLANAAKLNW